MPPVASDDKTVNRWYNRLLTALTIEFGGELHIPAATVRALEADDSRAVLVEEVNLETDDIVLRFFSKHTAVYPVESEACHSRMQSSLQTAPQTTGYASSVSTPRPQPPAPAPSPPAQVRAPLSDQELARIAKRVQQMQLLRRLRTEQARRQQSEQDISSEILAGGS